MYDLKRGRGLSLRTKLSLVFVGLAVVPCLSMTLLVSRQLTEAIEFWSNPGLRHSFTSSVEVARETLRLLEGHLIATVQQAAQHGTPERTDLDIWRVYERRNGELVLRAAEPSGAGLIISPAMIEQALASEMAEPIRHEAGWLLAVAPLDSAQSEILVGGYRVATDLAAQIEAARQGTQHIGELGLYKAVHQGWVWVSALLISLILVGGSILLARRLSRSLTRPIEEMVGAMAQLGRGDPVEALEPPVDREMGYLVRSFNSMVDELERSRVELQRAERLAAWQDVARRVAHEIKNPLTPIQFAIHRLKKQLGKGNAGRTTAGGEAASDGGPSERGMSGRGPSDAGAGDGLAAERARMNESLDSILGEVETLRSIAESFSQLAKLPEPQFDRVQAAGILREVAELYRLPTIELDLQLAEDLPEIRADRRQLRQVFNNLMQNGVEAMPAGGRLHLTAGCNTQGTEVWFEIRNSTGAIADSDLERIWEPYFTTKRTGTGLGLAVVGKIVRDHGGHIELDNLEGGGVIARVGLPVAVGADQWTTATADGNG